MHRITLEGNPLSTNSIYRSVCRGRFPSVYMTTKGKDLKTDYQYQCKGQFKGQVLECPLKVKVVLFFKDKRVHDIDNYNKILLDSLTDIVWKDDSQIQEINIKKCYDKDNPRTELTIYEKVLNIKE